MERVRIDAERLGTIENFVIAAMLGVMLALMIPEHAANRRAHNSAQFAVAVDSLTAVTQTGHGFADGQQVPSGDVLSSFVRLPDHASAHPLFLSRPLYTTEPLQRGLRRAALDSESIPLPR